MTDGSLYRKHTYGPISWLSSFVTTYAAVGPRPSPRLFCKYRLQLCDETSDVVLEARIGLEPPQGQIFQALTLAATLTIVGITLKLKARQLLLKYS